MITLIALTTMSALNAVQLNVGTYCGNTKYNSAKECKEKCKKQCAILPKTHSGFDPLMHAPTPVAPEKLEEYGLKVIKPF